MVFFDKIKPFYRRVPTIADVTDDIQRFDLDNLYPQRAVEVIRWSHTLKAVLDRNADFLNGEGFQNSIIAAMKMNNRGFDGETGNDVLNKVCKTYAPWKTIPLHINYNLNYRICSITPIPFEYCRLGVQDDCNKVTKIVYSTNWEQDGRKETKSRKLVFYDIFNPDPATVMFQISEAGGIENYKGQILFLTPDLWKYPDPTFNPVFDDAQAEAELSMFKVAITQNKFLADLGIVYPGEFESEKEKAEFEELIEGKSGARNAGKRIGMQDKTGKLKASDIFTVLTPANNDKVFEYTEKSISSSIRENYSMPSELIGKDPEVGMFNQDNMESAYTYYNAVTRNDRAIISRAFSKILAYWETPINDPCIIKPQQYILDSEAGTAGVNVRDNLANMSGRQSQNMGRIIRQYAQGKITYEQAKVLLQGGFGLSNEEIDKILGINEDEPVITPTPAPAV